MDMENSEQKVVEWAWQGKYMGERSEQATLIC